MNSIATRLLKIIPRVTLEEFYWQDSHYSTDSRLGRELLYLIANDEWIRTTTEILDVSRSDAVDTTIRFDIDLDQITHEAFHAGTGQIWLPLFTLIAGSGDKESVTLTVTDADGTDLAPVPQADVRHQVAAALAEIIVNYAVTRRPVHATLSPSVLRPAAGRDQRLLLSAALFRLLNGDTGDEPGAAATVPGTDRLTQARGRLTTLLHPWVRQLSAESGVAGSATARAVTIIEAFTRAVVVVVGVDRRRSPAVLRVTAPTRRLTRSSPVPWPLRWLALMRPRAHVRIDLLLPSADADRQVQVNLPDGVAFDTRRVVTPHDGLWIASDPPAAAKYLSSLVGQLCVEADHDHAIRRGLADLALARADTLAETLRENDVAPSRAYDDTLLTIDQAQLADATRRARERLTELRGALIRVIEGNGPDEERADIKRLREVWDSGEPVHGPLLRSTATDSPGPRRLNGRADHIESESQRTTPRYARINVPVYVPDANSGSVARFAGLMNALLMVVTLVFFTARLGQRGGPSLSAEAIASALTLFSVIPFSRIEIPDRSTLRGWLSFAGISLFVALPMPPVFLAIVVAFDSEGRTPIVASVIALIAQIAFVVALWRSPLSPAAGANARPPRILSTSRELGYELAGTLRADWWRSTTASALVTGRAAHAYVVWEHPELPVAPELPEDEHKQEPSLHRLLSSAARTRAGGQIAALTTRIRAERRERTSSGEETAGSATVDETSTESLLAQWPPNLLALLRSGTASEALTFLVFREPPDDWPPPGGVAVQIDPDQLAPTEEANLPLDVWVGLAREREFSPVKEHALVTALRCAAQHGLFLLDTQFPAPPPVSDRECVWIQFRIGLNDRGIDRLGPYLRDLRSRLSDCGPARRLLVRTAMQAPAREIQVADAVAEQLGHGRHLVLARELDVVAIANGNGRGRARQSPDWRVLAICADARDVEHQILETLAKTASGLRLAALYQAVLHSTTVLLMLCHQAVKDDADLAGELTRALPGANVQVAVDEWQSAEQLGMTGLNPLLRVRARSQDRPGMLLDVLNGVRPALRAILPDDDDPYGAVAYAMLRVSAGRATVARINIRLQVEPHVVAHWDGNTYGEIERDARSRAIEASTGRQDEYGAPENTVITVSLIRC